MGTIRPNNSELCLIIFIWSECRASVGAASFAEKATAAERGKKKNGCLFGSVFLFVGAIGQCSNSYYEDLKCILDF